jgi:hypothetical protein
VPTPAATIAATSAATIVAAIAAAISHAIAPAGAVCCHHRCPLPLSPSLSPFLPPSLSPFGDDGRKCQGLEGPGAPASKRTAASLSWFFATLREVVTIQRDPATFLPQPRLAILSGLQLALEVAVADEDCC